jgi:hypothetical protein
MIDWLAVIVICIQGECAFWADTKTPHQSKEACEQQVIEMSRYFTENKAEPVLATCLPIKFVKV